MLIVWPKIPQMPKNVSVQFVCPSKKVLDFNKKRLHWAFVIRDWKQASTLKKNEVHKTKTITYTLICKWYLIHHFMSDFMLGKMLNWVNCTVIKFFFVGLSSGGKKIAVYSQWELRRKFYFACNNFSTSKQVKVRIFFSQLKEHKKDCF